MHGLTRKISIWFILSILAPVMAAGKIQDGMLFRSYDVPAEMRTSLCVPAGNSESIGFYDSLAVSFSIKIELNKGTFGYICRMAIDDLLPVDIMLTPSGSRYEISATADHLEIIPLTAEEENVEEWKDFYVGIREEGDQLVVSANGKQILRKHSSHKHHKARLFFGKVDAPGFATSDAAPMILADLMIRPDRKGSTSWLLSDECDLQTRSGISIKASNYLFLKDMNRKWALSMTASVPSVSYSCFSGDDSSLYYISDGLVTISDIISAATSSHTYASDMKMSFVRGEFVSPPDGSLIYADPERGEFIPYDRFSHEWGSGNGRTRTSVYMHHNTLWLPESGRFVQILGYGQHRYSNLAFFWSPSDPAPICRELKGIAPRYLAAAGVKDGKIYVLGGKGNSTGRQELGTVLFDDFCEIDPDSCTARTLWHSSALTGKVAARDIVFEDGGKSFLALLYNPEIRESSLQLYRFSFADGSGEPLADPIPYNFYDISSEAGLHYYPEHEFYMAAICHTDNAGTSHISTYLLGYPILAAEKGTSHSRLYMLAAAIFMLIAGRAAWLIRKRRETRAEAVTEEEAALPAEATIPRKPGVYLLGGFHVLDHDGNDIASSFSPILVQFLSILVLYTGEKGGISNAMLKSLLWADKSDESFNNNKGVNLRKLRTLLGQVGDILIVSENGACRIEDKDGLCDYLAAQKSLSSGDASEVLRTASRGALLPEYQFDWLDPVKSRYTNLVFSRLDEIADAGASPEMEVRIADCKLLHDTLDEQAVQQKCAALVSLGKVGTAKAVFQRFTDDYKRIMDEEFEGDFTEFVKKIRR